MGKNEEGKLEAVGAQLAKGLHSLLRPRPVEVIAFQLPASSGPDIRAGTVLVTALMKRRAQTAAAPAVAKRKKLAKDELLENETYDSQADVVGDRASKSRGTAPTVPLATSSATPKTAATASPRTAADNIARRPRDDLSLVPPIRSALSPLPAQSSLPMYSMSPSNQMASKSYLMAVDPSSSAPSPARLPLTVAPLLQAPLTLNSPVCWARVNRMAWWPGKVCTRIWTPESANFPASTLQLRFVSWLASELHLSTEEYLLNGVKKKESYRLSRYQRMEVGSSCPLRAALGSRL